MIRLLQDADELSESFNLVTDENGDLVYSFADIVDAIHIIQTEMGITGTTALEAGRTISGSVGSMKSAWTNLVTGFADGSADIGGLIDNLVTTIVGDGTENNLGVIGNVLPAIERALGGVVKLISGASPKIIEILPGLVDRVVPSLITAATDMVKAVTKVVPKLLNTIVNAIIKNAPLLIDSALELVGELVNGVLEQLPQIVDLGLDLIVSLASGISESLPELIPTIVDVILKIVNTLTSPEQLQTLLNAALTLVLELTKGIINAVPNLVNAALQLVMNLIDFILDEENLNAIIGAALEIILAVTEGLEKAIPQLVGAAILIIEKLCEFFLDPENISMLINMAFDLVVAISEGLGRAAVKLVEGVNGLTEKIVSIFEETDWNTLGKNIVDGLMNGLKSTWETLKKWFTNAWDDLVGGVEDLLGIHSPSRVFASIGKNMALGVGEGWEDEFGNIQNDIDKSLAFDDPSMSINAAVRKIGAGAPRMSSGGTSIGNITINIDGAKYSDEQSLAAAIAQEIQNMTDRRVAVYA